jgi:hypothetical protein
MPFPWRLDDRFPCPSCGLRAFTYEVQLIAIESDPNDLGAIDSSEKYVYVYIHEVKNTSRPT